MKSSTALCLICASMLLLPLSGLAKDKPRKQISSPKAAAEAPATCSTSPQTRAAGSQEPWVKVDCHFSTQERLAIQQYADGYNGKGQGKPRKLPPGLAKKVARGGDLPPGWQKKCVVGETMPQEVYEQCHPLPRDLVVKLPPAPEPTITVAIGGKVVRLLQATREILDVFDIHVRL